MINSHLTMNDFMNNIVRKQNTEEFIDLLCAQRHSYTKAKTVFVFRLVLSVLFAVLGPILILNLERLQGYVAISAIFYTIIDYFILRNIENRHRQDGAKIQESFDTGLFNLDWNNLVVGERPDNEKVYSYSQKYKSKNDIENLTNWYSQDISELELPNATVICQRTNIWWDVALRERLFWMITVGIIVITFIIFIYFYENSVVLLSILATLLPLYETLVDYAKSQRSSITRTKALKNKLENIIESIIAGNTVDTQELRTTQDEIYRHRASCLFVPDWFYFLFRDEQEGQMNYSARHYIDRITNAQP